MNPRKLQDRLYLSLGIASRHIGESADAFRPSGPFQPLDRQNRFLRLPATFVSTSGTYSRTNIYGEALWYGVFDASYTRTGDYLVVEAGTFFVASQSPLLPILCVRTNRIISIAQPAMQSNIAGNSYGGYISGHSVTLMEKWPASVLGENRTSRSEADLPTDQVIPYWEVLVPSPVGVALSPGDIITDDLDRTAVITGSELTNLGWRLSAKMATT
jgi:hypothetical protein